MLSTVVGHWECNRPPLVCTFSITRSAQSLLENSELSRDELLSIINDCNENKVAKDIGAFDVLLRKGIIKRNVEGLYQINSDLSEQNSERLGKLAQSRLVVQK